MNARESASKPGRKARRRQWLKNRLGELLVGILALSFGVGIYSTVQDARSDDAEPSTQVRVAETAESLARDVAPTTTVAARDNGVLDAIPLSSQNQDLWRDVSEACSSSGGLWLGGVTPPIRYRAITVLEANDNCLCLNGSTTALGEIKRCSEFAYSAPTPLPDVSADVVGGTEQVQRAFRIGARCADGWRSNATGRGACSWHGGVSCWRYSDGTCRRS